MGDDEPHGAQAPSAPPQVPGGSRSLQAPENRRIESTGPSGPGLFSANTPRLKPFLWIAYIQRPEGLCSLRTKIPSRDSVPPEGEYDNRECRPKKALRPGGALRRLDDWRLKNSIRPSGANSSLPASFPGFHPGLFSMLPPGALVQFSCVGDDEPYGERGGKAAGIRSCWIVLTGEEAPRFVTCYIL